MPATALGTGIGFPIMTAIGNRSTSRPQGFLPCRHFASVTGVILHLAVGWGLENQTRWKYNVVLDGSADIVA